MEERKAKRGGRSLRGRGKGKSLAAAVAVAEEEPDGLSPPHPSFGFPPVPWHLPKRASQVWDTPKHVEIASCV